MEQLLMAQLAITARQGRQSEPGCGGRLPARPRVIDAAAIDAAAAAAAAKETGGDGQLLFYENPSVGRRNSTFRGGDVWRHSGGKKGSVVWPASEPRVRRRYGLLQDSQKEVRSRFLAYSLVDDDQVRTRQNSTQILLSY
jgi:hypothetical protein